MSGRFVATAFLVVFACRAFAADPGQDFALRETRQKLARLHWQQAVAARDVEFNSIKATHHFLQAGKLWGSVGTAQDVVDALHASAGAGALVERTFLHGSPIYDVVVSPDEKLLFTCSLESNAARIWSLETGQVVRELVHTEPVVGGVFHADGKLLVTRSYGGVFLWDLDQEQPIRSVDPNAGTSVHGPVSEIRFRPGTRQVLIRNRGSVYLWDAEAERFVHEFKHWANAIDLDADARHLMTAGRDGQLRLWDLGSGKPLGSFKHPAPIIKAEFLANGRIVTFAYDDPRQPFSSTGRVWSLGKDEPLATLSGGHGTNSLVVHEDGQHALSAGTGSLLTRDAFLWSLDDGSKIATYHHEEKIGGALFARTHSEGAPFGSPNRELVVTYTAAGTVKVWSREDHRLRHVLSHPDGISGLAISPSGEWLAIWDQNGVAKVFAMPDNLVRSPLVELRQVLQHADTIRGLTFLGEDRAITWSDDTCVRLWNLRAGQPTTKMFCVTPNRIGTPPPVKWAGENCWWVSWKGAASVWSSQQYDVLRAWPKDSNVHGVATGQNGKLILTWGNDRLARLWNHDGDEPLRQWEHEANVRGGTFLPGQSFVVTWALKDLNVWDTTEDKPVRSWRMESEIVALELLPDGRAVVGCQTGGLAVVSLLRDEPTVKLGRAAAITGIKVSADGQRVATWDAKKRISVRELDGKSKPRHLTVDPMCEFELDAELKLVLQTNWLRREAWLYSLETRELLKQFHCSGKVDGELFRFRLASSDKIVSWGTRANSNRVRLRVWSVDDLSSPAVEYALPGLPREFAALPDGIAMVRFNRVVQALSLQEHRVLRQFHQHRFGLNQMLFAPVTSQLYTTNPRGDFWRWDFHRQNPQTIAQAIEEFEVRSGMTIDADGRYRVLSISTPAETADDAR